MWRGVGLLVEGGRGMSEWLNSFHHKLHFSYPLSYPSSNAFVQRLAIHKISKPADVLPSRLSARKFSCVLQPSSVSCNSLPCIHKCPKPVSMLQSRLCSSVSQMSPALPHSSYSAADKERQPRLSVNKARSSSTALARAMRSSSVNGSPSSSAP